MTMPNEPGLEKNFVRCKLPWIIAAAAAVVYLLTLNHWLSLTSLWNAARISGYSWSPELHAPLYYLVTFPVRWLPAKHVPLALNLFALLCAVLTLALLARSVALLPHDRTEQQRQRERNEFSLLSIPLAWIPPVLAALVCGLQLTFWERATAASNENALFARFGSDEMFNLLLLAYCIRCLLEYRIGQQDSWLMRAALVWGLAISNSWLMFCLLPMFMVSMFWIRLSAFWLKRLEAFNLGFLGRMLLCVMPGLLLFLLLPVIQKFSGDAHRRFLVYDRRKRGSGRRRAQIFYSRSAENRTAPAGGEFVSADSGHQHTLVLQLRRSEPDGELSHPLDVSSGSRRLAGGLHLGGL